MVLVHTLCFLTAFAPQPQRLLRPASVPVVRAVHAPPAAVSRIAQVRLQDDGSSGSSLMPGEKTRVAIAAVVLGYAAGAAGITPAGILAAPGALVSNPIMRKAAKRAIGGGLSGAIAGVVQVLTLMWLRTTMNYQYRYGSSTKEAMKKLYEEGGIARFYQGVQFAVLQTPLSRFGDTAANTGMLELLALTTWGVGLPIGIKTAMASAAGSLWRVAITPVDTLKTTLQVEGPKAYEQLKSKVAKEGVTVLYQGAIANAVASFVGSFPWFFTFNFMMANLPAAPAGSLGYKLLRSAVAGVTASGVSDVISNGIRVLKTTRQTSPTTIGYREAAKQIIDKDGIFGLIGRGLGTRLMTNAIQASLFTVVWKYLEMTRFA